ncbi:MAG: GNAT family N-acetyltransferase [Phycisphaerales bacterium]
MDLTLGKVISRWTDSTLLSERLGITEHTVEILRRAFKAGDHSFRHQVRMRMENKLYGATHLLFELRKEDCPLTLPKMHKSLALQPYESWDAVPEPIKASIAREFSEQYWGKPQWLELGWRLWIGTLDGELAILSWTREKHRCEDFFFPLSDDCAVIWQTITVPAFRGRGLCPVVFRRLAIDLFTRGFSRVYLNCRNYNTSSKRAIQKAGFKYIGQGFVRKGTGQGVWYPVVKPFTLG